MMVFGADLIGGKRKTDRKILLFEQILAGSGSLWLRGRFGAPGIPRPPETVLQPEQNKLV